MRELRLAQLEQQPMDWYSMLEDPRRPLTGLEGETLFRHEGARSRRHGGPLTVLSLKIDAAGPSMMRRLGEVATACVRDCDFVSEGQPGELLIGLPGADLVSSRICVDRIYRRLDELPPSLRPYLKVGVAQLGETELVEDTVARARAQRE